MPAVNSYTKARNSCSIYIHLPYCLRKCPYCDFNAYSTQNLKLEKNKEQRYLDACLAEIELRAEQFHQQKIDTCRSIYFGGGTPSLFSAHSISSLIKKTKEKFSTQNDIEITLEANPENLAKEDGLEYLKQLAKYGVNRISLGIQSFNEEKLTKLGRVHSAKDCDDAISSIRSAGISNFSIDLIFGVPGESLPVWQTDLASALAAKPNHLSMYSLTIEPGTEFARQVKRKEMQAPVDEAQASFSEYAVTLLKESEYQRYEVSNFSKEGFSSQHNSAYWSLAPYIGIGAGAHSFLPIFTEKGAAVSAKRWSNIPKPEHYEERLAKATEPSQRFDEVSLDSMESEYIFCRLRTREGIELTDFSKLFRFEFLSRYAVVCKQLQEAGLLELSRNNCALTNKGLLLADHIAVELTAGRN